MNVYFDYRVTTTVDAVTLKDVICEHCGTEYHYGYRYVGQGHGKSMYGVNPQAAADRSRRIAVNQVETRLRDGIAPVACPSCGKLQADMVKELKRRLLVGSQGLGYLFPAILAGIAIGSALLASDFFDRPLAPRWWIGLGLIASVALFMCAWFGIRVLLEVRTLTTNHFGFRTIPLGTKGRAPREEVTATVVQSAENVSI